MILFGIIYNHIKRTERERERKIGLKRIYSSNKYIYSYTHTLEVKRKPSNCFHSIYRFQCLVTKHHRKKKFGLFFKYYKSIDDIV
jgi:hypothetical protein